MGTDYPDIGEMVHRIPSSHVRKIARYLVRQTASGLCAFTYQDYLDDAGSLTGYGNMKKSFV